MDAFTDDPIQAALAHAFEESPIIATSTATDAWPVTTVEDPVANTTPADNVEGGSDESWKEDLERLDASWRADSAITREKAERERERWRILREQEAATAKVQKKPESEWEDVISPVGAEKSHTTGDVDHKRVRATMSDVPPGQKSPGPDVRDLIASEVNRQHFQDTHPYALKFPPLQRNTLPQDNATFPQSNVDDQTLSGSRTWEDVPSLDSSFPSFSMHDPSPPASGPRERPPYQHPPDPLSVTLSIFDRSLSPRARTLAVMSSIAINLFLPFVNGVMLGFGEIFAKNILGYFGWELPGTALGIRTSFRGKRV
ncbi:hypothetical protein BU17DRAFT_68953 [Hysterangium stoloniferum]|nr:hypothetical protein BU17DRAFT_68953 [Hysterangium stoloniferum]